jgi:hypothetical protein
VIEHYRLPDSAATYTPAARLIVTPGLRTSGLLASLSDEAGRTLLALLTFLNHNGNIQPGTEQVAEALGISDAEAKRRIQRLANVSFAGGTLIHLITQETGRMTCVLSRQLVSVREAPTPAAEIVNLPVPTVSRRDEIIAESRSRYARPREEVERIVAEQLGHNLEDSADTPEGHLRRRVLALGVAREQVRLLFANYPLDQIERQLDWLPYRKAKDPARFLMAAIEGRYDAPPLVRIDQAMAAREQEQQEVREGVE